MTVKKAIRILDWWIAKKKHAMATLKDEWKEDTEIQRLIFDVDRTIINNLETIRKELVPNCIHPKELHDIDPDGNRYCMDCNLDL